MHLNISIELKYTGKDLVMNFRSEYDSDSQHTYVFGPKGTTSLLDLEDGETITETAVEAIIDFYIKKEDCLVFSSYMHEVYLGRDSWLDGDTRYLLIGKRLYALVKEETTELT